MATYTIEAPGKSSSKGAGPKGARKSGHGKSHPMPLIATPAPPLAIAASKPRNPIAVDALLKKSGPHDDKRRAQKIHSQEQLRSGLDEVRRRQADD
ncbi:MAG: hypothetical protein ABIZ64_05540 [Casimicrobium sp.]